MGQRPKNENKKWAEAKKHFERNEVSTTVHLLKAKKHFGQNWMFIFPSWNIFVVC